MPSYCSSCDRSFGSLAALKSHLASSSSPHPFRCSTCAKVFGTKEALENHTSSDVHKRPVIRTKPVVNNNSARKPLLVQQQASAVNSTSVSVANHTTPGLPSETDDRWSVIPDSHHVAVLAALSVHSHDPKELLKNKYVLDQNFKSSRKCKRCGGLEKKTRDRDCSFHPGRRIGPAQGKQPGLFSCCGTRSKGCVSAPTHDYRNARNADRYRNFTSTPAASSLKPKFKAVVLDCEMAGVTRGRAEAICICAVDYLTGAVLLNKLVWPAERVVSWRTDIHGITSVAMQAAVSKGQALAGWEGARQELWKLIDDSTILVGHALQHDLEVLRIIHHRVVDSAILAQNAVGPGRQWGLKTLCTQLLQKEIRENDGGVHDCLEDVLATREVALLCTQNKEGLRNWAEVAKAEEERKVLERKAAQLNKKAEKAKGKKSKAGKSKAENSNCDSGDMHSSSEFEIEIMRWSDVAEDFGWPHPDTGYDPWSD